jgi:hypothetical protein
MALMGAPLSVAMSRTEFRAVVQPFLTPQGLPNIGAAAGPVNPRSDHRT